MGHHVYCIVPAGVAPERELTGLQGAPVALVDAGAVGVWVSAHEQRPGASADAAQRHNHVVAAAMSETLTPVPARFGQWFEDADMVSQKVREEADRWRTLLDRFAGRAEYGVRILRAAREHAAQDVHRPAEESGRAYMAALAQREADAAARREEAQRVATTIDERIGGLAAERLIESPAAGRLIVALAYLVAWRDAPAYHSALKALREEHHELRLLFTGPWPPYSFVA